MHESTLRAYRRRIDDLRWSLVREVIEVEDGLAHLRPEDDVEKMDQAQREIFEASLAQLDDDRRRELEEAEAALERLKGGVYGTCEECGKAIDAMRLDAVPTAARCESCQEESEQRAGRQPLP